MDESKRKTVLMNLKTLNSIQIGRYVLQVRCKLIVKRISLLISLIRHQTVILNMMIFFWVFFAEQGNHYISTYLKSRPDQKNKYLNARKIQTTKWRRK